jgi:ubiquinone/menaquinone biosynthesis C-methylase UbiE
LDIQEAALDSIREKAKVQNLTNIEPIRANLEVAGGSSLPNSSQDLVMMANILFQSSKRQEIIKEARRVLKEGGRLVIIDWKKNTQGFGPPNELRTDEETIELMTKEEGLTLESKINGGKFHFGIVFRK